MTNDERVLPLQRGSPVGVGLRPGEYHAPPLGSGAARRHLRSSGDQHPLRSVLVARPRERTRLWDVWLHLRHASRGSLKLVRLLAIKTPRIRTGCVALHVVPRARSCSQVLEVNVTHFHWASGSATQTLGSSFIAVISTCGGTWTRQEGQPATSAPRLQRQCEGRPVSVELGLACI
jgi:hypothetical protein